MDLEAQVVLVKGSSCYQWIIEQCPYCAARHMHGAGDLDYTQQQIIDTLGPRVPHCINKQHNGYKLVWDGKTKKTFSTLRKVNRKLVRELELKRS